MRLITKAIKGPSGRHANLFLGRTEQHFWQDECFDHWIRNRAEFEKVKSYIEQNPVRAGLVTDCGQWPWSSVTGRPLAVLAAIGATPQKRQADSPLMRNLRIAIAKTYQ